MNDTAAPKTKKAPVTRAYPVFDKINDQQRWVEAPSKAAAIVHVYDPVVGEPLSGSAILDVIRTNGVGAIEQAKVAAPATKTE